MVFHHFQKDTRRPSGYSDLVVAEIGREAERPAQLVRDVAHPGALRVGLMRLDFRWRIFAEASSPYPATRSTFPFLTT